MSVFFKVTKSKWFNYLIIFVIILAGILVGLETSTYVSENYKEILNFLNKLILYIFVIEAIIKILSFGSKPWKYFNNPWNIFDFLIVSICFIPIDSHFVAVLRLIRLLRVIRLITVIPRLQMLVNGLLKSIPSMFYVTILLSLLFYVYAVMGVFLFRENDPGHFGNLGKALISLFRIVTLEDWTDIMYTAIYGSDIYNAQGPIPVGSQPKAFGVLGALYFISFVITGSMVMINMFIGIVLTSLTEAQAEQLKEKLHLSAGNNINEKIINNNILNIEKEIHEIRLLLKKET